MPIRQEEIFEVLRIICEEDGMYATAKSSIKGGLIAGTATVVGGLLMGPPGLAIGGSVGGLLAYSNANQFQPVGQIIMEMPQRQKNQLQQQVSTIIAGLNPTDAIMLLAMIRADPMIYGQLINFVRDFVTSDLHMSLKT